MRNGEVAMQQKFVFSVGWSRDRILQRHSQRGSSFERLNVTMRP